MTERPPPGTGRSRVARLFAVISRIGSGIEIRGESSRSHRPFGKAGGRLVRG